jgi:hypothetical protein
VGASITAREQVKDNNMYGMASDILGVLFVPAVRRRIG